MPITDKQLEKPDRIYFHKAGEVTVLIGPCSGMAWTGAKIPLDGRHYRCAGKVILKSGQELRADLALQTHTFDFLEREHVHCRLGDAWYRMDEPELMTALGIRAEDAFPYRWSPDRPLDYHKMGPYPMSFANAAR